MKILIVDDEPLELFISKKFLAPEFEVEGFNNIPDAVQWARGNEFDIIISDYYLGGNMSAADLFKALVDVKKQSFKSYVLTNHIEESKIIELKKMGFNDVIEKPLSLEKFKKIAEL